MSKHLDKQANAAVERFLHSRSVLAMENAAELALTHMDTKEVVQILRDMAQHLEEHG